MIFALLYSALLLLIAVATAVTLARGNRTVALLKTEAPADAGPMVSIVVAARNEAASIASGVRALMALDYKNYDVWVVDDRSEDTTGQILAALQKEFPTLNVLTIEQLPAGWLGKNNALHQGAQRARGEIILFTDADVILEPSTLSRAVGYMQRNDVEHLAVSPQVIARGLWLNAFLNFAALVGMAALGPWKARDPKSPSSIGVGAFNLVRREAYLRIGGHQRIALRPDDDLMLGRALKRGGVRQDFAFGRWMILVEWYPSLRGLIAGLEKNLFAAHDYKTGKVIAGSIIVLAVFLAPFVLMASVPGLPGLLSAAAALVLIGASADNARFYAYRPVYCLLFPFGAVLSLYTTWNATLKTLRDGGISWRGTRYALEELRKNEVP